MVIQPLSEYYGKILAAVATGNARLHFSQLAEDGVIWQFYQNVKNGFYVDVGCHHPFRYSNTALLSMFNGWTGLNVDADRRAIDLFQQYRPQDINVHCAVGNKSGSAELFLFNDGAVNTVDPAWADRQTKDYGTPEKQVVDIRPLSDLLDRYLPPGITIDLLNIDIEGFDQQAIESNDWQRYRPKMVCIETHNFDLNTPADNPTFQYMNTVGYYMIAHVYATSVYMAKPQDASSTPPTPVRNCASRATAEPGAAMIATGSDCMRAARESADPQTALLYYSAAEASGVEDDALFRERHAVLQALGQRELAYLNARCGPWRDETALNETEVGLRQAGESSSELPDTAEPMDPNQLIQAGEYRRALDLCKLIIWRDKAHPYVCYLAGVCVLQTPGLEGEALTWFNIAERFKCDVKYFIPLNRAELLRRVGLYFPALQQATQLVREQADERSLELYYGILETLLTESLKEHPKGNVILPALRVFHDEQKGYNDGVVTSLEARLKEAVPDSASRQFVEPVADDNLPAAASQLQSVPVPAPLPPTSGPVTPEIEKRLAAVEGMLAGRVPNITPEWAEPRYYENSVQIALSKLLRFGDLGFDVGSNIGVIAAMMGAAVGPYGRVVAFESSPRTIAQLHVNLNHSNAFNVTVLHAAVADRSGQLLPVYYAGHTAGDTTIRGPDGPPPDAYVPSIALDDYVERLGIAPRVVKIDIEGAELLAIQGFQNTLRRHHPAMIIETLSSDLVIDEMLRSFGYNLCVDLSNMDKYDKRTTTVYSVRNLLYLHESEDRGAIFRSARRRQVARFAAGDFMLSPDEAYVDLGSLAPGLYVVTFGFSPAAKQIHETSEVRVGSPDRLYSIHIAELRDLALIRSIPFELQRQTPAYVLFRQVAPETVRGVLPAIVLERLET